jgi:hypothetical protein
LEALKEYIDHFISVEGEYKGIRQFHLQRAKVLNNIRDLVENPQAVIEDQRGKIFASRKIKIENAKQYHFFVGQIDEDGRIRGITVFPKNKSKLKYIPKNTTAPSPVSSSVGAGLAVPGPATPSKSNDSIKQNKSQAEQQGSVVGEGQEIATSAAPPRNDKLNDLSENFSG